MSNCIKSSKERNNKISQTFFYKDTGGWIYLNGQFYMFSYSLILASEHMGRDV